MRILTITTIILGLATPASARKPENQSNPNRIICRTSEVIGSRLQTKKTCLSAIQWSQLERDQRTTVERVQAFKPNQGR